MRAFFENFGSDAIRAAFAGLGSQLGAGHAIEILVVGGAAGLLTNLFPASVTTSDVDAVHFRPPNDVEEVLQAAQIVAEVQGITKGWLSIDAGLYFNAIPDDWELRRVDIGWFGRLHVYAIGRVDLIAMKFFAHRQSDIEHLTHMNVMPGELTFTAHHLEKLFDKLPNDKTKIEMGLYIVENWGKS